MLNAPNRAAFATAPSVGLTVTSRRASNISVSMAMPADLRLVSLPISPFAARARLMIYDGDLAVKIVTPAEEFGGFKNDAHNSANPLGKVPVLLSDTFLQPLFESGVISEYLAEKSGTYLCESIEERTRQRLVASILDQYIVPYHHYMYKRQSEDSNNISCRSEGIVNMEQGWTALESALHPDGPYVGGKNIGVGDAALWGCMPFYDFMLPAFFGKNPLDGRPKIKKWYAHMQKSKNAVKVYDEVWVALEGWWDGGRWTKLEMKAEINPKSLRTVALPSK